MQALQRLGKPGTFGYSLAEQLAGQAGISKDLYFMLSQPGAIDKLHEQSDARHEAFRRMGLDYDEAGKASVDFQNKVRSLGYDDESPEVRYCLRQLEDLVLEMSEKEKLGFLEARALLVQYLKDLMQRGLVVIVASSQKD